MKYRVLAFFLFLSFLRPLCADELQTFAQTYLSLSNKEISDIRSGKVVAKLLDTHDKREVAVVG
ncbi:MAG TPA: hypothetical protein VLR94_11475, partial [Acidobacteriota bacterium]|nr:hypothetical protein [Acidobacteriota bacterium]